MSAGRDVTPIVRSWLEQRGRGLADPYQGFDRFLELVDATPQAHRRWWVPGRQVPVPAHPQHTPGRSRSMLSATRLTALVAMVALGTGAVYLAAGQGPSPVPSLVPTAAPSPTAASSTRPLTGLLASLVTEEVEPGVLRVVSDGHRNLSMDLVTDTERPSRRSNVVAGPDGSVWLFGADEWFRVGEPATYPVTEETPNHRSVDVQVAQVAPDGTLWTLVDRPDDSSSTLMSFEDGSWTVRKESVAGFDLELDGTVWVTSGRRFVRLRDGWQTPEFTDARVFWVSPGLPAPGSGDEVEVLVSDDTGQGLSEHRAIGAGGLLSRWGLQEDGDTHGDVAVSLPAGHPRRRHGWTRQLLDLPDPRCPSGWHLDGGRRSPATRTNHYLVHVPWESVVSGESVKVYTDDQGVPELGGGGGSVFRAAPDGSVWLTPQGEPGRWCGGIANFDGTTWTRYLPGRCVLAFDIAPDGTVWLQAYAQNVPYLPEEPEKGEKAETLVIPG